MRNSRHSGVQREPSLLDKGAKLVNEYECGATLAAKLTETCRSAIKRAKKALQECRPVRKIANFNNFSATEEQEFVEKIENKLSNCETVTYRESKRIVSFVYYPK